jgi:hypothetical protein
VANRRLASSPSVPPALYQAQVWTCSSQDTFELVGPSQASQAIKLSLRVYALLRGFPHARDPPIKLVRLATSMSNLGMGSSSSLSGSTTHVTVLPPPPTVKLVKVGMVCLV